MRLIRGAIRLRLPPSSSNKPASGDDEPLQGGFEVGGFELGLVPDLPPGEAGAKACWGVDDIADEVSRLRDLGVTTKGEIQEVGGIKVVDVADPFGNLIGLIENPNFKLSHVE